MVLSDKLAESLEPVRHRHVFIYSWNLALSVGCKFLDSGADASARGRTRMGGSGWAGRRRTTDEARM